MNTFVKRLGAKFSEGDRHTYSLTISKLFKPHFIRLKKGLTKNIALFNKVDISCFKNEFFLSLFQQRKKRKVRKKEKELNDEPPPSFIPFGCAVSIK